MARANGHWRILQENSEVTAIFHGPDTYITPSWYASGRDVPTWNYAVVHIQGRAKLIENFEGLTDLLRKMTARFEVSNPKPWRFELPDDLLDPATLVRAIVGFEIEITDLKGKFKLSQNRSTKDRDGVLQGLLTRPDDRSRAIHELMTR